MTAGKQYNSHDYSEGTNGGHPPEPEVIIIDDGQDGGKSSQGKEFADIGYVANLHYPLRLRILFLVLSFLSVAWCIGSILCWSFLSLFHLITLYRFDFFEPLMVRFWVGMVRAAAISIGFLVAFVAPPLGLGLIMLYFTLYEDSQDVMAQMLRKTFRRYSS